MQLLKAYHTIFDAFKMSEVDNGPVSQWEYDKSEPDVFFNKYLAPYIKGLKSSFRIDTLTNLGYEDGIKYPDNSYFIQPDAYNAYGSKKLASMKINDGSIIFSDSKVAGNFLSDGTVVDLMPLLYIIYIDINGSKKPNIVGQDVFAFSLPATQGAILGMYGDYFASSSTSNGKFLTPKMQKSTTDPKDTCKKNAYIGSSLYCGAWIKLNGWKIPDDYPYL